MMMMMIPVIRSISTSIEIFAKVDFLDVIPSKQHITPRFLSCLNIVWIKIQQFYCNLLRSYEAVRKFLQSGCYV
jgi:hypothetical protein